MAGDLSGLAQLALMIAAARKQAILGRRSQQEELAARNADRLLRQQEFQWRLDQQKQQQQKADQEAATARAKPFLEGLYGKDSADMLADLQAQGRLPEYVQNAAGALGPAGYQFDPAKFLAGLQFQQQVTPQPDLQVPAPARAETATQSFNPESAFIPPDAVLQPAGDVAVPLPPLVQQILPHSLKTQQAGRKVDIADLIAQARVPLLGAQTGLANTRAGDITATQPGRVANLNAGVGQKQANTALTKARTGDIAATQPGRVGLLGAQIAATKSIPGYRQGQLDVGRERNQITKRGQDITAATARRGQDIHQTIAAAAQALKTGAAGVPASAKPFLTRLASLGSPRTNPLSGQTEILTPEQREAAAAGINNDYQRVYGRPLFGPGGVLSGGAPQAGGKSSGAPKKAAKLKPPGQMSVGEILQELAASNKGK